MDAKVGEGSLEVYSDKTGRAIWKKNLLATSVRIANGRVFIVSRSGKDDVEALGGNYNGSQNVTRPLCKVVALDLKTGRILWETTGDDIQLTDQPLSLEAVGYGAVAVTVSHKFKDMPTFLSSTTGKELDAAKKSEVGKHFFRYRESDCAPSFRLNGEVLSEGKAIANCGGAKSACIVGIIPAYGAAYTAQNYCTCRPGQIQGLTAVTSVGTLPSAEEMQREVQPVSVGNYDDATDGFTYTSQWTTFRGNAERSSGADCDIPKRVAVRWSKQVTTGARGTSRTAASSRSRSSSRLRKGKPERDTVKRDWLAYLNSRLTAPVICGATAIVGDIDHNEVIAVRLSSGAVAWRYMLGGRMDSAATVYKGICLVGDHSGYVHAIKIKTGCHHWSYKSRNDTR